LNDTGGSGEHACDRAFDVCLKNGERLYDKGYVDESHQLYLGCRAAHGVCYQTEKTIQTFPDNLIINKAETYFPPNKDQNGGGFVSHETGFAPVYVGPSTDPVGDLPPKKR
jgi:hypothetical protein